MRKLTHKKLTPEQCKQLGIKLRRQGKLQEAEDYCRHALTLAPLDADVRNLLGNALNEQNRLTEAITYYQEALSLNPRHASAFNNLGQTLLKQGNQQGAINALRIAVQIEPSILCYQNLLLALQYVDNMSQAEIAKEHFNFNRLFMARLPRYDWTKEERPAHRPLRVGYVSGDFRLHSMAFFISQLLKHHDREQFQVTCYFNNQYQDEITAQFKTYADSWVNCATLTDEQLSHKIWQDKIDILVDLSGHTALNRLGVFARSPAPVQMTYLGYPNTTGLTAMNYQLVSATLIPPYKVDDWKPEKVLQLPKNHCCFDPLIPMPEISELPALRNGYLTFASFSRLDKVSNTTFELWCEILRALPTAHLFLSSGSGAFLDANTCNLWLQRFNKAGINSERLSLTYLPSMTAVFQAYQNIDIILDTYPYNGCTTTCQAIFMGVPVVSLVGETIASRVGLDLLQTVGLTEWVAVKLDDYLPIVLYLSKDLAYLQTLRMELRPRMLSSSLMDGVGFTRTVESLYKNYA